MQTLRRVLDSSGLSSVGIVASDDRFKGIAANMLKDPELNNSISIIGSATQVLALVIYAICNF